MMLVLAILLSTTALATAADNNGWQQLIPTTPANNPIAQGAATVLYKSSLFVLGGQSNNQIFNTFSQFDIQANAWVRLPSLIEGVHFASAVVHNDTMFVFGGKPSQINASDIFVSFNLVNPSQSSWQSVAFDIRSGSPPSRLRHAAVVVKIQNPDTGLSEDVMFMYGGMIVTSEGQTDLDDVWKFSFGLTKWARIETFPKPSARHGHVLGVLHSGHVICAGGQNGTTSLKDAWSWSPTTSEWSPISPLPTPRVYAAATVIDSGFVMFGGLVADNTPTADLLYLDEVRLVWSTFRLANTPSKRWGVSAASFQTQMYLFGGSETVPSGSTMIVGLKDVWVLYLSNPCSLFSTCDSCTQQASLCGWCFTSGTCVAGSIEGSDICPRGFSYGSCPHCAASPKANSCSSCAGGNCVWCESSRTCTEGDAVGPYRGTCDHFKEDSNKCANCAQHTDCNTCSVARECGWCFANNTCNEGDDTGSFYQFGCQNPDAWLHNAPCPNCHQNVLCDSCTRQPKCGYCLTSGVCYEGNGAGTFLPNQCERGYHHSFPCPNCAPTSPQTKLSCGWCANHSSEGKACGWCSSQSRTAVHAACVPGDAEGAFNSSQCPAASDWVVNTQKCTTCAGYFWCETCLTDRDCRWCNEFGGYCLSANNSRICESASTEKCDENPPTWDPSAWHVSTNSKEGLTMIASIGCVAIAGILIALVWWKRQSKKRLMPDAIALLIEREKAIERESQVETYIYRNPSDSAGEYLS